MTTFRVICCFCQAQFDLDTRFAGIVIQCPQCRGTLTAPLVPTEPPTVRPIPLPHGPSQVRDSVAGSSPIYRRGLQAFLRLPVMSQFILVGLACLASGALFGSGCTALRRYSAQAYKKVVARAERAENELAVLKESQERVQPTIASPSGLTLQPAQRDRQPASPRRPTAEHARIPLDGDVRISIEVAELPVGQVRLSGATNLPTDTLLMLSVEEQAHGGFIGQSKCSVAADGSFTSEAFGPPGGLKDGVYVAGVVMPIPSLQPEGAKKIIGSNGENLCGPLVEHESFGATVSVKKQFTIGGEQASQAQQERVKDRIQEYRTWQKKLVALHSRLQAARGSAGTPKWGQFAQQFRTDIESHNTELINLQPMSARFAIGDPLDAVNRMFLATAFEEPQDYNRAGADYAKGLDELERFITEAESEGEALSPSKMRARHGVLSGLSRAIGRSFSPRTKEPAIKEPAPDVIGSWLDETPYLARRLTITKRNGKIVVERRFKDNSGDEIEVTETQSPEGRRFDYKTDVGRSSGGYYLINRDGQLEEWVRVRAGEIVPSDVERKGEYGLYIRARPAR